MKVYTSRPKSGNGRKAWDKFVEKYKGAQPREIYYTPNYDHEFKGWVCELDIPDPGLRQLGYGAASLHDFYPSSEL